MWKIAAALVLVSGPAFCQQMTEDQFDEVRNAIEKRAECEYLVLQIESGFDADIRSKYGDTSERIAEDCKYLIKVYNNKIIDLWPSAPVYYPAD